MPNAKRFIKLTDNVKRNIYVCADCRGAFGIHRQRFDVSEPLAYTVTHLPSGYAVRQGLSKDTAERLLSLLTADQTLDWQFTRIKPSKPHRAFLVACLRECGLIK